MNENPKDIFNTITERAKNVTLSEKEKANLFRTVDAYVRKHPIMRPAVQAQPRAVVSPLSGSMRWFNYFGANHSSSLSFALVIFVVLGASTSFAAQGSLPGDLLYAVKVGVNEQVHALFLTDINKTKYEASRAVERVKEAQELATQGKLTDTLNAQIVASFDAHTAQVQKDVEQFQERGEYSKALQVADQFETALKQESSVNIAVQTASAPTADTAVQKSVPEAAMMAVSNASVAPIPTSPLAAKVQETIQITSMARVLTENSVATAAVQTNEVRKVAEDKHAATLALIADVSKRVAAMPVAPAMPAAPVAQPTSTSLSAKAVTSATAKGKVFVAKVSASASAVATTTPPAPDSAATILTQASVFVKSGDESFAAGRFNEAFGFYRAAYDAAVRASALVK